MERVKGGITAAKAGNLVIMAPNTHMYLNHYQSNMLFEPLAHGRVASLEWVYSFNPIPDVLTPEEAKKVLGIQGNVWTEYLPTYQLVEYMAYPRASAVAEIGWSQPENRNWKDYLKRLQIQFERWRYYQVNCALPINYHDVVLKVAGKHGEEEGRNIEWATVMGET